MFPSEFCFALFSSLIAHSDRQPSRRFLGGFQHVLVTAGSTASRVIARLRAGGLVISSDSFLQSKQPARQPGEPHAILAARHRLAVRAFLSPGLSRAAQRTDADPTRCGRACSVTDNERLLLG